MKKSDLHREWARVLDMCVGNGVNPNDCAKYNGKLFHEGLPPSFDYEPELYQFAAAILEAKPVWGGEVVYHKSGSKHIVSGAVNIANVDWSEFSWNPPKKTFMLNGEELPCPIKNAERTYVFNLGGGRVHFFDTKDKCNAVLDAIDRLLLDNTK